MKKETMNGKNIAELERLLREKRDSARVIRFGSAGSRAKNVKESAAVRKDIAKILTAMNSSSK